MTFVSGLLLAALFVAVLAGFAWLTHGGHQPANASPRHVHTLEWYSWWASCLSLAFGVVALALAYVAYTKAAADNRNSAGIGFTARYREQPYQDASRVLLDVADGDIRNFAKASHTGAEWRSFVKQLYYKHDLVHVMYTELEFYDDLYECVASNICDWRLVYIALRNEVGNISVLSALIFDLARNDPEVGEEAKVYWAGLGCGFQEFVKAKDTDVVGGGSVDIAACPNLVRP